MEMIDAKIFGAVGGCCAITHLVVTPLTTLAISRFNVQWAGRLWPLVDRIS